MELKEGLSPRIIHQTCLAKDELISLGFLLEVPRVTTALESSREWVKMRNEGTLHHYEDEKKLGKGHNGPYLV